MSDLSSQKKKAVMRRYNRILEKHGKMAKYISKSVIYREVALPFFISHVRVGVIILEMIKKKDDGSIGDIHLENEIDTEVETIAKEIEGTD